MDKTPKEVGRGEFDEWCWRRGLELSDIVAGLTEAAARLTARDGRPRTVPSIETVRRVRLPFDDAKRRVPRPELVELICEYTAGEIVAAHFYPPHLRGGAAPASVTPASETAFEGAGR